MILDRCKVTCFFIYTKKNCSKFRKKQPKKTPALMEWGPLFMGVGGGVLFPGDDVVIDPDYVG